VTPIGVMFGLDVLHQGCHDRQIHDRDERNRGRAGQRLQAVADPVSRRGSGRWIATITVAGLP